jgi:sigma-B regulation protein RsbU (phosphoserine phosphatase)
MFGKTRYTLTAKFAVLFAVFAMVVGFLVCSVTYVSYRQSMLEHYGTYALGAAKLAASILDPWELLGYAQTLRSDDRYAVLERELGKIRSNLGVKYLYIQMPVSDAEFMYLFDIYDPVEANDPDMPLGTRDDYNENFKTAKLAMSTGEPTMELEITKSEYGYLASAYVPIACPGSAPFAYVGVDIAMDDILIFLRRYLTVIASATATVMAVCFSALFLLVRRAVVAPIKAIAKKTGEFTRRVNDLDFQALQISSNDEIGDLSVSVNKMFGDIREFAARLAEEVASRQRVQSELDMARTIQDSVLPKNFPPFPDFPGAEVFASMTPAKEVGGDFYDFFIVGENKLALVIADASGKGVPAALFMMEARTLIKNRALSGDAPHKVLETVNDQLCQGNDAGMFVTAFIGVLDVGLGVLRYANAGHNPPILLSGERALWLPVEPGLALGVLEGREFAAQETAFGEESLLLIYTDGVTEALNEESELFGDRRLMNLLSNLLPDKAQNPEETKEPLLPKTVIEAVIAELGRFAGDAEQADDTTLLACKIKT